jgi:hypothetical protein
MKIFGSISRLVSILFRKNSQDITLRPNQATTYTGSRDIQFPEGDVNHVLVSKDASQTLTNKTIDGDDNTVQDLGLSSLKTVLADADKVLVRDAFGAVTSAQLLNSNVDASAAIARSKLASGTASHVVINDGSGVLSSEATLSVSRGGTGASSAQAAFDALSPTTTRGDLIAQNAAGNDARLALGAANEVLTSDGSDPQWGLLANANLSASAAVERSKLANGTADHVVINNGTGGLSSEANLAISRGGTGAATASTALNNLLPTQTGNSGKVLSTDGAGNVTWISNIALNSVAVDWESGTSLNVDHNFGTTNVLVQVYDKLDGSQILLDDTTRATANRVTLTSSQAPGASGWKVLVLAI